jgi:nitrogen fixation protein
MNTIDFVTELFCHIDDQMATVPKHSQALLYPSEVVTLAFLFVLKGTGTRAFYRWLEGNWREAFPHLPHRTRLFRLFMTHRAWSERFLEDPTVLGVIDAYGVELIHPIREGRSPAQIGKKGLSNHRWIVGGKLCLLLNQWGLVVAWDCETANVPDTTFQPLIQAVKDQMIVLSDTGFHAKEGDPVNLKICPRGHWNVRMVIETVLSMLTVVCQFKKMRHRLWKAFQAHLAFGMALFNVLVQWHGFLPDEHGFRQLSLCEFSL